MWRLVDTISLKSGPQLSSVSLFVDECIIAEFAIKKERGQIAIRKRVRLINKSTR